MIIVIGILLILCYVTYKITRHTKFGWVVMVALFGYLIYDYWVKVQDDHFKYMDMLFPVLLFICAVGVYFYASKIDAKAGKKTLNSLSEEKLDNLKIKAWQVR